MSVNKVVLIGNLGSDPEVRATSQGNPVANISVATKFKDKTTWHRVVLWNQQARFAEQYLKKGAEVFIEGRLDYREWTDKEGHKHVSAEIVAYDCQGLGPKDRGATGRTEPVSGNVKDDGFDEIPF